MTKLQLLAGSSEAAANGGIIGMFLRIKRRRKQQISTVSNLAASYSRILNWKAPYFQSCFHCRQNGLNIAWHRQKRHV
jgi:hypothetical protein